MWWDMYITPPTVQTGKLASARVGAIWADDTVWLDGVSRQARMVRKWSDWCAWEDTAGQEVTKFRYYLLHRWDTLYWRVGLAVSGPGTATVRIYCKGTKVMEQTKTSGSYTFANAGYDVSGLSLKTWELVPLEVRMETQSGTTAQVRAEWMEERPGTPSAYQTPGTYADGAASSAAEMNKIASAISGLNSLARWPVIGFPQMDSGYGEPSAWTALATWKHFHHGDTLHYRVRLFKDGSNLRRSVAWRMVYAGSVVASGSYSGAYNADGEGEAQSGTVSIAGLANQNDQVDVAVEWQVTGGGDGNGRVVVDYVATAAEGGVAVPGRIAPMAYVYGNTAGQTATLQRIADCLKEMAGDDGTGYNATGRARMFARSVAMPAPTKQPREKVYQMYLMHTGWPTLRYRARRATLHWGDGQSMALEDWPAGDRYRTLDLRGLQGLSPGMAYYIASESGEIEFAAEVRS